MTVKVVDKMGKPVGSKKVVVSVSGGGMAQAFTDGNGTAQIATKGSRGKIIVNGRTVHDGSLSVGRVVV